MKSNVLQIGCFVLLVYLTNLEGQKARYKSAVDIIIVIISDLCTYIYTYSRMETTHTLTIRIAIIIG